MALDLQSTLLGLLDNPEALVDVAVSDVVALDDFANSSPELPVPANLRNALHALASVAKLLEPAVDAAAPADASAADVPDQSPAPEVAAPAAPAVDPSILNNLDAQIAALQAQRDALTGGANG